jgi:hypothetical protein
MRFNLPILRRLAEALRKRDWFGIGFELLIVVLGVMLGIAASRWSAQREERQYQRHMVAALDETLTAYVDSCRLIHDRITAKISDYDRQVASGKRPPPPYWRLPLMERPPTLAWEAMVATGIARSIDPGLVLEIARFFSRGDSWGDRYYRYNVFTETEVLPYLAQPQRFYGPNGKLRPEYAAHIDRLREVMAVNDAMGDEAAKIRAKLKERS